MKKDQENRPVEVFGGTSLHAALVKSMLENEEIVDEIIMQSETARKEKTNDYLEALNANN